MKVLVFKGALRENDVKRIEDTAEKCGAALDVFKTEPLPAESRLWKVKNLLITPHSAGNLTLDYTREKNVEIFCENLLNYAEGKPLNCVVDKQAGY